ncbi:MAG: AAA family ATPase, partial [Candidatus Kapaibacterium sp.]
MGSISHRGHIPFVGRRDELRRLALHRSYLEGNRERGRHLVVVEGFSGVGKTALVQEFLASLEQDGRSFTPRGAYSPYLRRPILGPLLDALDSLFVGGFAQRNLRSIFTDATYYPLLERLPLLSSAIGYEPHDRIGGSAEPAMLAALIASALAHAAHFRPVVLLLDDIQWMPQEDLETMPALNSGLHNAPVLILATMRRDGGEPAPLRDALRKLSLDDLYLPPLTPPDIAALVTEMYGAQVSSQIAADIAHVSEGVPMRAVEILRTLIDRGVLIDGQGGNCRLSPGYHRRMLAEEGGIAERVRRLDRDEVRTLLLLNCASGVARRDELANWFAMLP